MKVTIAKAGAVEVEINDLPGCPQCKHWEMVSPFSRWGRCLQSSFGNEDALVEVTARDDTPHEFDVYTEWDFGCKCWEPK